MAVKTGKYEQFWVVLGALVVHLLLGSCLGLGKGRVRKASNL